MRKILFCSAAIVLASGCSDATQPRVPASVVVSPGPVAMSYLGAAQVVHAVVSDGKGRAMKNATVTWSSSSPAVAVAGAGGDSAVVTAAGNGAATITARAGEASGGMEVTVAQAAASLARREGDFQTGTVGTALGTPLRVQAFDRSGAPAVGATVAFAVTSGGGSVADASVVTGADGTAATTWTLGTAAGSAHAVTASAPGVEGSQLFTASATAGAAAQASISAGGEQTAARESAVPTPPRVDVRDAFGNPVPGVMVRFAATGGGGSVTGALQATGTDGQAAPASWRLGPAVGANTLTATFPGSTLAAVSATATATASAYGSISVVGGGDQAAMAGTALPTPPSVILRDPRGVPVPGVPITMSVYDGFGSVTARSGGARAFEATVTTDADGVATLGSWIMGPAASVNVLSVYTSGYVATPTQVRAAGCSGGGAGYAITLCFTSQVSGSQRAIFEQSARRWSTVITVDLPDVAGEIPAGLCSESQPRATMTVDDLVIFASVVDIDGAGKILGQAGPCILRSPGNLPVAGVMEFDKADLQTLEYEGWLGSLILHEMGHVLGIGTLWSDLGLLRNPSTATNPLDTYFSGAGGIEGFDAIGGTAYAGMKVPVENAGGAGTRNAHWRESVLRSELMTGYLAYGSSPLSVLTVRSLADLGYTVDPGAADGFLLATQPRANHLPGAGPSGGLKLHDDGYPGPRFTVDRRGRRTRIR